MKILKIVASVMLVISSIGAEGQEVMTLDEAIWAARQQSVQALQAKAQFVSSYWAWRSYLASRLPSLFLYGNLANFNRSLTQMQNFETGELVYTGNNNLQNSIGLSLSQNITSTGGTLSLYSNLSRVDQFGAGAGTMWFAQPLTFTYSQPLLSFNSFKWDKLISPKEYEMARRTYMEAMEALTLNVARSYYDLLLAQLGHRAAVQNYENTETMLHIAEERMKVGSVTRDEYLQLKLRMLNDSLSINENAKMEREARLMLNSIVGLDNDVEIEPMVEKTLPDVELDWQMVYGKAVENSSFAVENDIKVLDAQSAVAKAKANRGASVALSARFGLSKSNKLFVDTYRNLLDQEVVGLNFTIPVFDWGMGRGRVKEAKAKSELVKAQVEQAENDFRKSVFTAVEQFNSQKCQCMVSGKAADIARERYLLMMDRFRAGQASVMELNTAQSEKDAADIRYIQDISNYWTYYYTIRQLALYDFIENKDLEVNYEELVN